MRAPKLLLIDEPPNALRVTYKVTIEIEGGKRPACVAEVIGQHYR